ncbi:MAG: hypothetical protein IT210_23675 [Armatimonadetes bacterium]|nr:hypothetical protein [Armatimonadota bacterium]
MTRLAWLMCLLAFLPACLGAETAANRDSVEVVAEGVAAVGSDIGKAEDEALTDALKNAVEQGVGVFVKAEALGRNYEMVKETILTRSEGYVRRWSRIEGSRRIDKKNGLLRLKIRATISLLGLIQDISEMEAVYEAVRRPRVMVALAEKNLGKPLLDEHPAEVALTRQLQEKGFDVVDREMSASLRKSDQAMHGLMQGDRRLAAAIGAETGAEILMVGSASSAAAIRPGEGSPYDIGESVSAAVARCDVKAISSDSGEVLLAAQVRDVGAPSFGEESDAGRAALEEAGSRLLEENRELFVKRLLARWARELTQGRIVQVVVSRASYRQMETLKEKVRAFRGHQALVRESYTAGLCRLDVRTRLDGSAFRSRLAALKLDGKSLSILRVTGNRVDACLR